MRLKSNLHRNGFDHRDKISIHDDMSIKFYEFIHAPASVINILKEGLFIPHYKLDCFYEEQNNKSAIENFDFLEKAKQLING